MDYRRGGQQPQSKTWHLSLPKGLHLVGKDLSTRTLVLHFYEVRTFVGVIWTLQNLRSCLMSSISAIIPLSFGMAMSY